MIEIVYLVRARPFSSRIDQYFNLWNAFFLLAAYVLFVPLFYLDTSGKEAIGWVMIGLILVLNLINLLTVVVTKII